jgi:hypothetical protein
LISKDAYESFINSNSLIDEKIIKKFSKENNISTGILVGRMQKDKVIGWNEFNSLITRI